MSLLPLEPVLDRRVGGLKPTTSRTRSSFSSITSLQLGGGDGSVAVLGSGGLLITDKVGGVGCIEKEIFLFLNGFSGIKRYLQLLQSEFPSVVKERLSLLIILIFLMMIILHLSQHKGTCLFNNLNRTNLHSSPKGSGVQAVKEMVVVVVKSRITSFSTKGRGVGIGDIFSIPILTVLLSEEEPNICSWKLLIVFLAFLKTE